MKTSSDFYINFCTIISKFVSLCLAIDKVSGVTELVRVCDSQATPDPPDRSMSTSSTKSYQVRPHSLINCKKKQRKSFTVKRQQQFTMKAQQCPNGPLLFL